MRLTIFAVESLSIRFKNFNVIANFLSRKHFNPFFSYIRLIYIQFQEKKLNKR